MGLRLKEAPKKGKSEDQIQKDIIARFWYSKIGSLKVREFIHHSPNGGERPHKISEKGKRYSPEGSKLKAMGTKKGFPDLFFFLPIGGYHGLFIELKKDKSKKDIEHITDGIKPDRSEATDEQVDLITDLNSQGYLAVVAYGYDAAVSFAEDYIKGLKIRDIIREPISQREVRL